MDRLFNTALTLMQASLRENSSRGDCLNHRQQHNDHDRHLAETAAKYVEEIVEDGYTKVAALNMRHLANSFLIASQFLWSPKAHDA